MSRHQVVGIRPHSKPPPSEVLARPFITFTRLEASGGVVLVIAALVALVWANSPYAAQYFDLWATKLTIGIGDLALSKPLIKWINDGLMAIFFFVVGMEIKREVMVGELSSVRQAALPVIAAVGGSALPAAIYFAATRGTDASTGWGIPMATDIAFALGALALLGSAIPIGLKVFLTALAIVDDIASVLVIAVFYSSDVDQLALLAAASILAALIVANALGTRRPLVYAILGILLWLAFVQSGIHATIAGVLLAMTIPVRARINATEFVRRGRHLLDTFEDTGSSGHDVLTTPDQRAAVLTLETACNQVETPLHRMEHALHPWATFLILPVFALANAGVRFQGNVAAALTHPVAIGVLLGLIVGKQLGITSFAYLAVRTGVATLPTGVTWRHIYGAAWLGGIGFTMSLFIAMLAFGDPIYLGVAKFAIIIASVIAGVGGVLVLRGASRLETASGA